LILLKPYYHYPVGAATATSFFSSFPPDELGSLIVTNATIAAIAATIAALIVTNILETKNLVYPICELSKLFA
jgi:hypothetical protein